MNEKLHKLFGPNYLVDLENVEYQCGYLKNEGDY